MTTRRAVLLTGLLLSACSGGEAARSVRGGDASDDGATRATLLEAPPFAPAEAGLCDGAPADLFGVPVWVDAAGLWRARRANEAGDGPLRLDTWEAGEVPRSPVVTDGGVGKPSLFVATRAADGCRLHVYDALGARLWVRVTQARDCTSPSAAGPVVAWPLADDGAGSGDHVAWLYGEGGPVWTTALDARPTTPAISLGRDEAFGGGSHWLVGTARGVVVVEERLGLRLTGGEPPEVLTPPAIIARFDETEGEVTSLTLLSDSGSDGDVRFAPSRLAVVTLRAPDAPRGLGDRARVLRFDLVARTLAPEREALLLPGPLSAHPVTLDHCSRAGGGSHWLCGADSVGAFVAAGQGWVGAWAVPSGEPLFEHAGDVTWTGLAVGSGGWIAGGGSHWLPSDLDDTWTVRLLHAGPVASEDDLVELEVASGAASGACVPSPLWDTDGDLAVPVLAEATQVANVQLQGLVQGLALAAGQPRPHGGATNAGLSVAEPGRCGDGVVRDVHIEDVGGMEIAGIQALGDVVFVYGARGSDGLLRRLVPHQGAREASVPAPFLEHVVPFDLGDGGVGVVASWLAVRDGRPVQRFTRLGQDLEQGWTHDVELEPFGAFTGFASLGGERFLVGLRGGSRDGLVGLGPDGLREPRVFEGPTDPVGLDRFLVAPDESTIMLLAGDDGALHLRRLDASLDEVDLTTYAVPDRVVAVIDATVDADGVVRVLVSNVIPEGGGENRWLRFDADLALAADLPAPYLGPMSTQADGATLINSGAGLVRVGPEDHLGIPHPLGPDLLPLDRFGTRAFRDTGFVVARRRFTPDGEQQLWIARTDRLGFASCSAAGLCLGFTTAAACDTAGACDGSGCDPDTGACASSPIPSCVP